MKNRFNYINNIKNNINILQGAFETVLAAFGMFSAIPVPGLAYRNRKYILCAFPVIGFAIGISWQIWLRISDYLAFPDILRGAGLCLLPLIITGGIHMDGYADTCDALASYASPERRREILHDPRRGAFAIIKLCAYFIAYFALCTALPVDYQTVRVMPVLFIFSRCLSGTALLFFPLSKHTGMAYDLTARTDRKVRMIILLESVVTGLTFCVISGWTGFFMLAAALWSLRHADSVARRDFGGWSGDLAGWFLQKAEFYMLAALVLAQYISRTA